MKENPLFLKWLVEPRRMVLCWKHSCSNRNKCIKSSNKNCCRRYSRFIFTRQNIQKVCTRYLIPKKNGILKEIKGIDKATKSKGIHTYDLFLPNKGDKIEKCTNHSQRFAQLFLQEQQERRLC